MILIIGAFILLISSIVLYIIERTDDIIITPTLMLGVPYSIILLYTIIINYVESTYYKNINILILMLSFMYIFLFFYTGRITKIIMAKKNSISHRQIDKRKIQELRHLKIYYFILIISFILIILHYITIFGIDGNIIENLISLKSSFSSGAVAHLINISNAIFIIIFNNDMMVYKNKGKLNKKQLIIYFIWMMFLLIVTAKYMLMMFVASLIISYMNIFPEKIKLRKLILWGGIFPILFMLVYIIRFISMGLNLSELPFDFIISHLNYYITGGFYAFSNVVEYGLVGNIGIGIVFAPILNIFNVMFGENLISTVAEFINIGNGFETNVFTMFGAFQYESGILGAILLTIIIGVFIFNNYYSNLHKPTIPKLSLYSYLGASLMISFFNAFYGTLNVWEIIIVMMMINYLERFKFIIK